MKGYFENSVNRIDNLFFYKDGETPIYRQIVEKAKKHHPESITNDIVRTDELLETGRYAFTWVIFSLIQNEFNYYIVQ